MVYGFAVLDSNKLVIKPHDRWADLDNQFYQKVTFLKQHGVKVLIAIGGWNDSKGNKYSRLVNRSDLISTCGNLRVRLFLSTRCCISLTSE